MNEPPVPVTERNSGIDADLGAIVMQTLAKNPADRFPDAQALAQALEPFSEPCTDGQVVRAMQSLHPEPDSVGTDLPVRPDGAKPATDDAVRWSRNVNQPAASTSRIVWTVLVLCAISAISLTAAYFGPSTTEAWTLKFDRLRGRPVPPGTGYTIELVRAFMYISLTCFIVGTRFTAGIRRMFDIRAWTPRLIAARAVVLVLIGFFVRAESSRHLRHDHAPAALAAWAAEQGITTPAAAEATSYLYYLPYSLINYIVVLAGLFAFPLIAAD